MAHQLFPDKGNFLTPAEVVDRLTRAFRFVRVDEQAGRLAALKKAAWMEREPPAGFPRSPESEAQAKAYASRLRGAKPGETLSVDLGDDENDLRSIYVYPDAAILMSYESDEVQQAWTARAARCARVLGYVLVVV